MGRAGLFGVSDILFIFKKKKLKVIKQNKIVKVYTPRSTHKALNHNSLSPYPSPQPNITKVTLCNCLLSSDDFDNICSNDVVGKSLSLYLLLLCNFSQLGCVLT